MCVYIYIQVTVALSIAAVVTFLNLASVTDHVSSTVPSLTETTVEWSRDSLHRFPPGPLHDHFV